MEVKDIIEKVREELRLNIPNAMEVCILLLDPDAVKYTSPLQCALYEEPVDLRPAWEIAFEKMAFLKQNDYITKSEFNS